MNEIEYAAEVQRTFSPSMTVSSIRLGLIGEAGEVADLVKKSIERTQPVDREAMVKELGDVLWYTVAKIVKVFGALDSNRETFDLEIHTDEELVILLCSSAFSLGQAKYPFETVNPEARIWAAVREFGLRMTPTADMSEIMQANVDKLRKRYPNGFSAEASVAKADEKWLKEAEVARAHESPQSSQSDKFIWCDIETTGLDPEKDKILAVGLVITDASLMWISRRELHVYVPEDDPAYVNMPHVVREMHTKSGLLQRVANQGRSLQTVESELCAWIEQHLGPTPTKSTDRPVMSGSSVHFDMAFIKRQMPDLALSFNRRLLDVSSFKVLAVASVPGAREWNDSHPPAAHTPLADIDASMAELKHWLHVFGERGAK